MEGILRSARAAMFAILLVSVLLMWPSTVSLPRPELEETTAALEDYHDCVFLIINGVVPGQAPYLLDEHWDPFDTTFAEIEQLRVGAELALPTIEEGRADLSPLLHMLEPDDREKMLRDVVWVVVTFGEYREDCLSSLEWLTETSEQFEEYQLHPDSTLHDLDQAILAGNPDALVKLPIVERTVPAASALVWILVLIPVYLYLLSLLSAMKARFTHSGDDRLIEWVFFHPGCLGVLLGTAWLALPGAVVLLAIVRGLVRWWVALPVLMVLWLLAAWVTARAWRVRMLIYETLKLDAGTGTKWPEE
jgi:hypothetical protein